MGFLHFVVPFSPVCLLSCYRSRRSKGIENLLQLKNAELTKRNCHWEYTAGRYTTYGGSGDDRYIVNMGSFMALVRHDTSQTHPPVMMYPQQQPIQAQVIEMRSNAGVVAVPNTLPI